VLHFPAILQVDQLGDYDARRRDSLCSLQEQGEDGRDGRIPGELVRADVAASE
jgi:hypothetical protein